jgi:hypothetical protein
MARRVTGPQIDDAYRGYPVGGTHQMKVVDNDLRDFKTKIAKACGGTTAAGNVGVAFFAIDDDYAGQIIPGRAPILCDTAAVITGLTADDYPWTLAFAHDTGVWYLSEDIDGDDTWAWTVFSFSRPATPIIEDDQVGDDQQTLTVAWVDYEEGGATLEAQVVIPATPDYAKWRIEVNAYISIRDTVGNNKPAARLMQQIDAAAATDEDYDAPPEGGGGTHGWSGKAHLHHVVATATVDKTYKYHIEVSRKAGGGGSCYACHSATYGVGGAAKTRARIRVKAERIDM